MQLNNNKRFLGGFIMVVFFVRDFLIVLYAAQLVLAIICLLFTIYKGNSKSFLVIKLICVSLLLMLIKSEIYMHILLMRSYTFAFLKLIFWTIYLSEATIQLVNRKQTTIQKRNL